MRKLIRWAAAGLGLLVAGAAWAAASQVQLKPLVLGTAHEAYFSVAFDGQHGIAVGVLGAVATTSDGGKTWKTHTAPTKLALLGVAASQSHEIAVGQMGLILIRDGLSGPWKKVTSGTNNRLLSVSLNSKGEAIATGAFGTVLHSSDWGQTWTQFKPDWNKLTDQGLGFEPHLYVAHVDDAGVITIAGELGLILRSTDGGQTWSILHRGDTTKHIGDASIFAMDLTNPKNSYAVGQDGTILHSTDDGNSWQMLDSGTKSILLGVRALSNGTVYVTGMHDMLVSQDDGKSWQHVVNDEVIASWYEGVAVPQGSNSVIAVGHSGQVQQVLRN